MPFEFEETSLPGVQLITTKPFSDARGVFAETYHKEAFHVAGITCSFIQDNHSGSGKNVLRGLHFQLGTMAQAKLVYIARGEILDVAVDIRVGSPTFGKWHGEVLSLENRKMLFIPEGFAHGFFVLSDCVDVMYKCSHYYSPKDEGGLLWSDPAIGINWQADKPMLSEKDALYPLLSEIAEEKLPKYKD